MVQISVQVPDNLNADRQIIVAAPDGRRVNVAVPEGMTSGDSFIVDVPDVQNPVSGTNFLDRMATTVAHQAAEATAVAQHVKDAGSQAYTLTTHQTKCTGTFAGRCDSKSQRCNE
jgi:hypothetical protein